MYFTDQKMRRNTKNPVPPELIEILIKLDFTHILGLRIYLDFFICLFKKKSARSRKIEFQK